MMGLYLAISPLVIFLMILIPIAFYQGSGLSDINQAMNRLNKCNKCGLIHREYQRKLRTKESECPHCYTYNSYFENIYSHERKYKYPLSPKINAWKAYKINKLVKNQVEKEFMDRQLEIYLKVQEKFLNELQKKKDAKVRNSDL